jgi:DNA-binding NarL/FixJ family response regulator
MSENNNKMELSLVEKNKIDDINLKQIEYFSNLSISKDTIIVTESINAIAITIRKFLTSLGFENIYLCKNISEAIKTFSQFINEDISIPMIIDYESDNDIQYHIHEILEIQPSAKIIIITTKEKSDPRITRLLDIGISSIIYKPLNMENIKKSLLHILEENNSYQESKTVKNFDLLINSHNQLSVNKIKDIFKMEQSEIESMIKNSIDDKKIIVNKEILEAACNQCNSTNVSYTSECPQCKGINFKQQGLIEHYNCGEVYPKEGNYNTCPKCNKQIGAVGKDYREFLEYYTCSSCNERFSKPLSKFICFECGNLFIEKLASWKKSKMFKIQK